jgi:hypothetical protein
MSALNALPTSGTESSVVASPTWRPPGAASTSFSRYDPGSIARRKA